MNVWIKSTIFLTIACAAAFLPAVAMAQSGGANNPLATGSDGQKEPPARAEQKVSLDLQNAPIREALEKLFRQTKSDFSLDSSVQGYVTLKVTDQPLENALRLIIARASVPLTYTKESGVYFIKPRRTRQASEVSGSLLPGETGYGRTVPSSEQTLIADQNGNRLIAGFDGSSSGGQRIDVIHLTYLDPADIAHLFNIIQIPTFSRQMGSSGSGNGVPAPRN